MKISKHFLAIASNCILCICVLVLIIRLVSKGLYYDAAFAVIISVIVFLMIYHEHKGIV